LYIKVQGNNFVSIKLPIKEPPPPPPPPKV